VSAENQNELKISRAIQIRQEYRGGKLNRVVPGIQIMSEWLPGGQW